MPTPEYRGEGSGRSGERPDPSSLPEELTEFLQDKPYAALLHGTDQGTVLVLKSPHHEIRSVRGRVPIHLRHELYDHPAAPVIRTLVKLYDRPDRPLAFEAFTNLEDETQRADFAALANQKSLLLLFYDETLTHRLTKRVSHAQSAVVSEILWQAQAIRAAILQDRFDFDKAKREVMRHTTL